MLEALVFARVRARARDGEHFGSGRGPDPPLTSVADRSNPGRTRLQRSTEQSTFKIGALARTRAGARPLGFRVWQGVRSPLPNSEWLRSFRPSGEWLLHARSYERALLVITSRWASVTLTPHMRCDAVAGLPILFRLSDLPMSMFSDYQIIGNLPGSNGLKREGCRHPVLIKHTGVGASVSLKSPSARDGAARGFVVSLSCRAARRLINGHSRRMLRIPKAAGRLPRPRGGYGGGLPNGRF